MNNKEYVYVMSNLSFSDILKIGWTRKHPNIRAKDLNSSGVPMPFTVEFVVVTENGRKLEKKIHTHLNKYRVNSKKEFFKISKNDLVEILTNELILNLTPMADIILPMISNCKSIINLINEIKSLCKQFEEETIVFFSKLNKENTILVVEEKNNIKYVYLRENPGGGFKSLEVPGLLDTDFYDDEQHIKNVYFFIARDIVNYREWLRELNDCKEIEKRIGYKLLKSDCIYFKKHILNNIENMQTLKNKYNWDLLD